MCGIAGSNNRDSGFLLYKQNLSRGFYSSSVTAVYKNGIKCIKKEGELNKEDIPTDAEYYLYHSRGPTVETLHYSKDDTHPFIYGRFAVAHNGIIENANELYGGNIGVDSRIIPYLIDKNWRYCRDVDRAIESTLNSIKGTFGLWILDLDTNIIRIVKSDITLYVKGIEFCSTCIDNNILNTMYENTVYKFSPEDKTMIGYLKVVKANKPKYFIAG